MKIILFLLLITSCLNNDGVTEFDSPQQLEKSTALSPEYPSHELIASSENYTSCGNLMKENKYFYQSNQNLKIFIISRTSTTIEMVLETEPGGPFFTKCGSDYKFEFGITNNGNTIVVKNTVTCDEMCQSNNCVCAYSNRSKLISNSHDLNKISKIWISGIEYPFIDYRNNLVEGTDSLKEL